MATDADTTRSLLDEFAALVSPGHVDALRAVGLDIIETERRGPYVFDTAGTRYIDCNSSAGIYNLGRKHPELVAELKRAARETDLGNFPLISSEKARLAQRLAEFTPGDLDCSVFSVMRGEAFDFACKLARGYTGRKELVALEGGWYGQTGFALSLTERADRKLFGPLIPEVRTIPFGDAAAASRAITSETAAVILEPIQAENHCRQALDPYLRALRDRCRDRGALLVFDETQTGMGRAGERFACQRAAVTPDVLVLGESLGGGLFPIAATVFAQALNGFMNAHPLIHVSTFGGSDLGCRVALKALEIYERERPWENAARRGAALLEQLGELADAPSSPIRSVAGRGLLLSLELGSPDQAQAFCRAAVGQGILTMPGQVAKHCVLLRPSLLIEEEQVDAIVAAVKGAAAQVGGHVA